MDALTSGSNKFAFDMLQKLSKSNPTENILISPFSITSALAMVLLGSKNDTAKQISEVLHFEAGKEICSNIPTKLSASSYTLNQASRLFGEKTLHFSPEFLSSLQRLHQAKLGTVDFLTAYEAARKEINAWVSEQTRGKIPEVLADGSVDSTTQLVLVNALYFKGDWAEKFDVQQTTDAPFRLNKNEQKTVKMMYLKSKFPLAYVPEMNSHILELPYVDNDLSMFIMLPDSIDDDTTGLQKIEKELTFEKFQEWTKPEYMDHIDVHVYLPQFKMEESYKLKSVLSSLGMVDLFNAGRADLSGIAGSKNLYLSEVVHQTYVEVNEKGTEAAAATAGIAMMCMLREEEFRADHPFTFFIRDNKSKVILFVGKYVSP